MRSFEVYQLPQRRVQDLYTMRPIIQTDPDYQRQSELWEVSRKQLFIDSLVNGFDVPKLYFHALARYDDPSAEEFKYAVVDGKQRLEAVWGFLDGKYALSDEFEFLEHPEWEAGGLIYPRLAAEYPVIASRLERAELPIVVVDTGDLEIIEELFSRLNEATPLNAPEKRNAIGGPLPKRVRTLVTHDFFKSRVPFTNNRYRHLDLATKFLYLEHKDGVADTKKRALDEFFLEFKREHKTAEAERLLDAAKEVLTRMSEVFHHGDPLLSSIGNVVVYYLLFRDAGKQAEFPQLTRSMFDAFETRRQENRVLNKEIQALRQDERPVPGKLKARLDERLLQYDRYAQSVNDSGAIRFKCQTIVSFATRWDENAI
jgi:hypothetical protein